MRELFGFVGNYCKNKKSKVFFLVILNIIINVINTVFPYMTGHFIDGLINGDGYSFLISFIAVYITLIMLYILINYFINILDTYLSTTIGFEINKDIVQHVQSLPLKILKNLKMSEVTQRINNDSNIVAKFVLSLFHSLLINILLLLGIFFILFSINKTLSILLMILSLVYIFTCLFYVDIIKRVNYELKQKQTIYFGKLFEQLELITFLKANGIEKKFIRRLSNAFNDFIPVIMNYTKITSIVNSNERVMNAISNILIFSIGGYFIINNKLTIGMFVTISTYFSMLLSCCKFFFDLSQSTQESLVSYKRLNEYLNLKIQMNGSIKLDAIDCITIKNLKFGYEKSLLYRNINLEFTKGNVYIFRGDNGVGKTTLLYLILGLYVENTVGNIEYNKFPIQDIDLINLRKQKISYVAQQPQLLTGSMIYNIFFDEEKINEEKCIELFKLFNIEKYYDDFIENPLSYSGGEIQKVSLIRALCKEFDLLILDEPTSALDQQSVINLVEYINKIKDDKIIIICSHDRILFKQGYRIIEIGGNIC